MINKENAIIIPPTPTWADTGRGFIIAIFSSIPMAGSVISEITDKIIPSPIAKRRQQWEMEVSTRIQNLEAVNIKQLLSDDIFIDVLMQTTEAAIVTSNKKKLHALANAVENVAAKRIDLSYDKMQLFTNKIREFTETHIVLMEFWHDPVKWCNTNSVATESCGSYERALLDSMPILEQEKNMVRLMIKDLHRAGFFNMDSLGGMISGNAYVKLTTDFGDEFMAFIKSYK